MSDVKVTIETEKKGRGVEQTTEEVKKLTQATQDSKKASEQLTEEKKRQGTVVDSLASKIKGGLVSSLVFAGLGFKGLLTAVSALRQGFAPLSESFDRFKSALGSAAEEAGRRSRAIQGLKAVFDALSESLEASASKPWVTQAENIKRSGENAGEAAGQLRELAAAQKEAADEAEHLDKALKRALGLIDEELEGQLKEIDDREKLILTRLKATVLDPKELATREGEVKKGAEHERSIRRGQAESRKQERLNQEISVQMRRGEDAQALVPTEDQMGVLMGRVREFQTISGQLDAERVTGRKLLGAQSLFGDMKGKSVKTPLGYKSALVDLLTRDPSQLSAEESFLAGFIRDQGGRAESGALVGFEEGSFGGALTASRGRRDALISRHGALRASLPATTEAGLVQWQQNQQAIANQVVADASGRITGLREQSDSSARGFGRGRAQSIRTLNQGEADLSLDLKQIDDKRIDELIRAQAKAQQQIMSLIKAGFRLTEEQTRVASDQNREIDKLRSDIRRLMGGN